MATASILEAYNPELAFGKVLNEYKFYGGDVTLYYDDAEHSYTRFADGAYIHVPSVTTAVHIIDKSGALTQWAANMTVEYIEQKLAEHFNINHTSHIDMAEVTGWLNDARFNFRSASSTACDIGGMAHDCLEDTIKHGIRHSDGVVSEIINLPENDEAARCVMAALEWMTRHQVKWLHAEKKIYSRVHDYAGTMDGLAYVSSCSNPKCCKFAFENVLSVIDWKSSNRLYDEYRYQTAAYEEAEEEETGLDIEHRWVLRLGKDNGEFEPWHITEEDYELDLNTFLSALSLFKNVEAVKERERTARAEEKAAAKAAKAAEKLALKEAKAADKARIKAEKLAAKEAEKAAKQAAKAAKKAQKQLDKCQVCKGAKGGVPGNENIVDGVIMCDYCTAEKLQAPLGGPACEIIEPIDDAPIVHVSDLHTAPVVVIEEHKPAPRTFEERQIAVQNVLAARLRAAGVK